jgi:hypothetical protein
MPTRTRQGSTEGASKLSDKDLVDHVRGFLSHVADDLKQAVKASYSATTISDIFASVPSLNSTLQTVLNTMNKPAKKAAKEKRIPATLTWFVTEQERRRVTAKSGRGVATKQTIAIEITPDDLKFFDVTTSGLVTRDLTECDWPRSDYDALRYAGGKEFDAPDEFIRHYDIYDSRSAQYQRYLAFDTVDPKKVLQMLRNAPAAEAEAEERQRNAEIDAFFKNKKASLPDLPHTHPRFMEVADEHKRRQSAQKHEDEERMKREVEKENRELREFALAADAFFADPTARYSQEYADELPGVLWFNKPLRKRIDDFRAEILRRNTADAQTFKATQQKFVRDWIKTKGTDSHRQRIEDGVLSMAEVMKAIALDAFRDVERVLDAWPDRLVEVQPVCDSTRCRRSKCEIKRQVTDGGTLSEEEHKYFTAIRTSAQKIKEVKDTSFTLRTETAQHDCDHAECYLGTIHFCVLEGTYGPLRVKLTYSLTPAEPED